MGQDEADGAEERVENNISLTPAPSANNNMQDSPDQAAPVRCSVQTTRNQLPLEVSKLWVVNRHKTNWHPGCMG